MAESRRAQVWLGTMVEIRAMHASEKDLAHAINQAFDAITQVHRAMTVHEPQSELSSINNNAHSTRLQMSDGLRLVLHTALDFAEQSNGLFDPTIGARLAQVGLLPMSLTQTDEHANWRDVDVNEDGVRFERPLMLDFGGIAKGYAVDIALEALKLAGCDKAIVNAGGDMACFGHEAETVHVRDPRGGYIPLLKLSNGALASSCYVGARKKWRGRWTTPLVDTRTQRYSMTLKSATVTAPSCMMADALTKIVLLSSRTAASMLSRHEASAVTLVSRGGELLMTRIE